MKLSECITEPGQVAVRKETGTVALWCDDDKWAICFISKNGVRPFYQSPSEVHGDDWVRVWPVEKSWGEGVAEIQIEKLKARIHELENPVLGEPLPVGYVIPAGTPYIYKTQEGYLCSKASGCDRVCRGHDRPRWIDPRPLPKLPEPEPRYTVECGATLWIVKRDGSYFCGVGDQADAERIAKLLNESEGE